MRYKWKRWTREIIQEVIRPANKHYLRERLGKTEEDVIEIGVPYPIVRNLLGVPVEEGILEIVHVSEKFFLDFLQDLVGIYKAGKSWHCVGTNDVSVVEH
ncbi:MAG: hypothetical protein ACK4HQ_06925, partial [Brevinematales bacterium]